MMSFRVGEKVMKINFVIPSIVLGGGVRMVFQYANYLTEQGHDVLIYVPKIFWPNQEGLPKIRTSVANTFKRGTKVSWYNCNFPIKLATIISDKYIRDADATFATAWHTAKAVSSLSDSKGKKYYFIQDYEVAEDQLDKVKVENTYKLPLKKIVIAKWLEKIVYEVSGEHTTILYNGVSDTEYILGEKKQNKIKTVIMLGNMAHHKGGKNGLEILKKIQKKYNIRVIVYGSKRIENFPSAFEFYHQPERKKLMELYNEADICLFPSIREGWGLIVTEAMAHKCAVVGNRTGAVAEIGVNEQNMLITSNFDPLTLEKALEKLILDENLLRKLQLNGFETVKGLRNSQQCKIFEQIIIDC